MFSTLKKLFGARADTAVDSRSQLRPVAPAPNGNPQRPVRTDAPARPVAPLANTPANLSLPLRAILDRLPPDLMQRVRQMDVGSAEISIPMSKVLSQIGQGSVKISFGELRQAAPPGLFTADNDRDRTLVELPLHEVLSRLNPALLSRRPAQKQVSVPAEVTGPFGGQTQVNFSTTPLKPADPVQPVAPPSAPVVAQIIPLKPTATPLSAPLPQPALRAQQPPISFHPAPAAAPAARSAVPVRAAAPLPSATPFRPAARPASPVASAAPQAELEQPFFRKASPQPVAPSQPVYTPIAPAPAPATQPASIPMPELRHGAPVAPLTPIAPEVEPEPEPIRFHAPPPAPVQPSIGSETRFLTVPIADLAPFWPELVQHEIAQHQMSMSAVGLPFGMIETAIKQGKVALPWRILRSWIKPPVFLPNSPHDALLLELPLKIITPLFLAELRTAKPQKKVQLDASIPDLFSGRIQPDAPAAAPASVATPAPAPARAAQPPAPASTDTNFFIRKTSEDQPEEIAPIVKKGPTPGTAFLARYATPNEIIAKAAALPGVDGVLIALPDGLLVASQIPATMNGDTIAAFLPQIFSRVTQCTKELRLGDLNNLSFTVGTTPWKIFKVGAIYLAAFGRAGEPLPTAQLAGIAAELDRKAK